MSQDAARHIPPQASEAEMSVLGAILLENSAITKALEIIGGDDFYRESHRKIFRAMQDLHGLPNPIDLTTLVEELKKRGELEETGGAAYLVTLVDAVPTAANISHYCRIVKEKSVARKILSASREMQAHVQDGKESSEIITSAKHTLDALNDEADAICGVNADDLIDFDMRNRQYQRFLRKINQQRFLTRFPLIDKEIRGVAPGEVLFIVAYSGTYKSALLQYLLLQSAKFTGLFSVFFSLEMPATKLFEREAAMQSGCNGYTVEYRWREKPSEAEEIHRTCRENGSPRLIVCDRPKLTIEQTARYIDATRRKFGEIGVAGIDYLGLMAAPGKTLFERTAYLAPELKNLAKSKNVPLIVLSQVNRESVRSQTEIETHSAKGGGDIEASADFMLGLYQNLEKALILKILKNRNGPAGDSFVVEIDKPSLRFGNLTPYISGTSKRGNGIVL